MPRRVLLLCTGNSCRSQMAEAILRRRGGEDYEVYSAGTHPAAAVNPMALEVLHDAGYNTEGMHPKHVNEFVGQPFHRVITVCDAANEECPYFPGAERIHWPFEDPAQATGTHEERKRIFRKVYLEIKARMEFWLNIDRRRPNLTPE